MSSAASELSGAAAARPLFIYLFVYKMVSSSARGIARGGHPWTVERGLPVRLVYFQDRDIQFSHMTCHDFRKVRTASGHVAESMAIQLAR